MSSRLFRPFEIKELKDTGQIAGYGSVFDVKDSYSDIVMPGAFARSLKERGMPKMLWQHNWDDPIGVWTSASEDKKGLYVEGQLALKTQAGAEAYELLKMGALDGLSIGYRSKVSQYDEESEIRKLIDVELYEVSPVTFPANEDARIESVKRGSRNIRDLEAVLRDAGLSRSEAKALLAEGFRSLRDAAVEVEPEDEKARNALRDAAAVDGESLAKIRAALRDLATAINPK